MPHKPKKTRREKRDSGFYKGSGEQAAAKRRADDLARSTGRKPKATSTTNTDDPLANRPVATLEGKAPSLTKPTEKTGFAIEGSLGEKTVSGLKNLVAAGDVINPFIKSDGFEANLGDGAIEALVESAAEHPFRTAFLIALDRSGLLGRVFSKAKGTVSKVLTPSKIGTSNLAGSATKFTTTPKSLEQTRTWLQKLYTTTSQTTRTNLQTGVSTTTQKVAQSSLGNTVKVAATSAANLVGMIGSYPFSGFLVEEAIQTIGIAEGDATDQGLYDLADELSAETDAMLDAQAEKGIIESLPYANSILALNKYFAAARIKNEAGKMVRADKRWMRENGQDYASLLKKRDEEYAATQDANKKYWADQQENNRKEWAAARAEGREEDAKYWDDRINKSNENELAQTEKMAELWSAYRKEQAESSGGGLGFGLFQ